MGRIKRGGQAEFVSERSLCYFCDREFDGEHLLLQHQVSKHFRCTECGAGFQGGRCHSLLGLVSHYRKTHTMELRAVPDAKEGRDDPVKSMHIHGMANVPEEVLAEWRKISPVPLAIDTDEAIDIAEDENDPPPLPPSASALRDPPPLPQSESKFFTPPALFLSMQMSPKPSEAVSKPSKEAASQPAASKPKTAPVTPAAAAPAQPARQAAAPKKAPAAAPAGIQCAPAAPGVDWSKRVKEWMAATNQVTEEPRMSYYETNHPTDFAIHHKASSPAGVEPFTVKYRPDIAASASADAQALLAPISGNFSGDGWSRRGVRSRSRRDSPSRERRSISRRPSDISKNADRPDDSEGWRQKEKGWGNDGWKQDERGKYDDRWQQETQAKQDDRWKYDERGRSDDRGRFDDKRHQEEKVPQDARWWKDDKGRPDDRARETVTYGRQDDRARETVRSRSRNANPNAKYECRTISITQGNVPSRIWLKTTMGRYGRVEIVHTGNRQNAAVEPPWCRYEKAFSAEAALAQINAGSLLDESGIPFKAEYKKGGKIYQESYSKIERAPDLNSRYLAREAGRPTRRDESPVRRR